MRHARPGPRTGRGTFPLRAAPALIAVAAGAVWVAWRGFGVETGGDYPATFAPPMNALLAGHLSAFFHTLPDDGAGGSVLLRAPGALLGKLLTGSQPAIYRFGALECMLAAGALGLWLARLMARRGGSPAAAATAVVLCLAAPAILDAILVGHPEEVLGAVLSVAAVLLAAEDRPTASGIALGLAIVNKPWAVLAIAPTLLAGRGRQTRIAMSAGVLCAAWFGAALLAAPHQFIHSLGGLSTVAHPEELWWPLAHLSADPTLVPGHYLPGLLTAHARELAVALMLPLSIPIARRPGRGRSAADCLALLALLFLIRCLLDPSNHIYYELPFIFALLGWQAVAAASPLKAVLATGTMWLIWGPMSALGSDGQWLLYMASAAAFVALLARPALGWSVRGPAPAGAAILPSQ